MVLFLKAYLATLLGVLSHLGFFLHGEHHLYAPRIFRLYASLPIIAVLLQIGAGTSIRDASVKSLLLVLSYAVGLFGSILLYRIMFHPLRNFPGPFMAKTTKLWNTVHTFNSKNYLLMDGLYRQYGDFIGPNEITLFRAEAVRALDGLGSKCSKAPWYDIMKPRVSVATTRDKTVHSKRRKIWQKAFSTQALSEYEGRLLYFADQLQQWVLRSNGATVNVSSLFYLYSFDVMSDLAFGEPLKMLECSDFHYAVYLLHSGMAFLGPFSSVPWLARIGFSIPGVAKDFKKLLGWSAKKLEYRLKNEPVKRDIMSWLIEASRENGTMQEDQHWLRGDCFAIVVAGSDTVASTLTSIFYYIAASSEHAYKLRAEIDSLTSLTDIHALEQMHHLNGMINEALRLHPALPSRGLRVTPSDGLTIGGRYIPGGVTVVAPRYSIGRLESSYEQGDKFIPERWYSKPEMVKDDSGFSPFSMGRHNCIGKNLAMMQMRSVVARLVKQFDVSFAPHEDGTSVWKNLKDQFNSHPGKLDLIFSPRKV